MGEAELAEIAALKKLAVEYDEDEDGDWYLKRLGDIKKGGNKASLRASKGKPPSARAPADAAAGDRDEAARIYFAWRCVHHLLQATSKADCLAFLEDEIEEAGHWKTDSPHSGVCTIDGVAIGLPAFRHYAELEDGEVCRVRLVDLGDRGWVIQMPKASIAKGMPLERPEIDVGEDGEGDDEPAAPKGAAAKKPAAKKKPPTPKKPAAQEPEPAGRGKRQRKP